MRRCITQTGLFRILFHLPSSTLRDTLTPTQPSLLFIHFWLDEPDFDSGVSLVQISFGTNSDLLNKENESLSLSLPVFLHVFQQSSVASSV